MHDGWKRNNTEIARSKTAEVVFTYVLKLLSLYKIFFPVIYRCLKTTDLNQMVNVSIVNTD